MIKSACIDDTGYSALDLPNDDFLLKLKIIKKQMKNKNHPIYQFIKCFDLEFSEDFKIFLSYNYNLEEVPEEYKNIDKVLEIATKHIYNILHLLIVSIIKFYCLELNGQELWKDLLLNALTNMILRKNVYFVLYNLTLKTINKDLIEISTKISKIRNISPKHLQIPDLLACYDPSSNKIYAPYLNTVSNISNIMIVESPIKKMEVAYNLFTEVLTYEVSEFWNSSEENKIEINIDSDNLKAIMIYVVIKSNLVTMLVDIMLSDNFTSKSIRYTNRAYCMTVLHSAFEFIQMMNEEKIEEIVTKIKESPVDATLYHEIKHDQLAESSVPLGFTSKIKDNEELKAIDISQGSFHMKQTRIPSNTVWKDTKKLISKNVLQLHLDFYNSGIVNDANKSKLSGIKSIGRIQTSIIELDQEKGMLNVNPFSALYMSAFGEDRKCFFVKNSNTQSIISESNKEVDEDQEDDDQVDDDEFMNKRREYENELEQRFDQIFS